MKNLRFSLMSLLLILATSAIMFSCKDRVVHNHYDTSPTVLTQPTDVYEQSDYTVVQSPDGRQLVIVKDHSGSEFLMEYAMWSYHMQRGGYNQVVNYYNSTPSIHYDHTPATYRTWKTEKTIPKSTFESSNNASKPVFTDVTPKKKSTFESNSVAKKPQFEEVSVSKSNYQINQAEQKIKFEQVDAPKKSAYTSERDKPKVRFEQVKTSSYTAPAKSSYSSLPATSKPKFERVK